MCRHLWLHMWGQLKGPGAENERNMREVIARKVALYTHSPFSHHLFLCFNYQLSHDVEISMPVNGGGGSYQKIMVAYSISSTWQKHGVFAMITSKTFLSSTFPTLTITLIDSGGFALKALGKQSL